LRKSVGILGKIILGKKKKGSNCSGEYLSLSEVLQLEEPGLSPLL
jgi:hypothetical protein